MCGVAPFGSSIISLLDNDTAASRYREVTFRAEEVDLSSRRGRARHPKGGRAGGWSEAAAPEGRPPGAGTEVSVPRKAREARPHEKELTYCGPFWGMHAERAPPI